MPPQSVSGVGHPFLRFLRCLEDNEVSAPVRAILKTGDLTAKKFWLVARILVTGARNKLTISMKAVKLVIDIFRELRNLSF